MSNKSNGRKKLNITFINPNSNKSFEEFLQMVIIEKIKNSGVIMTGCELIAEGGNQ